jgi:Domain of unknown function (DUF4169)
MAEIVNLRRRRKAALRQAEAGEAAENRTRFGRTKAERQKDAASKAREQAQLDHKRLDKD